MYTDLYFILSNSILIDFKQKGIPNTSIDSFFVTIKIIIANKIPKT